MHKAKRARGGATKGASKVTAGGGGKRARAGAESKVVKRQLEDEEVSLSGSSDGENESEDEQLVQETTDEYKLRVAKDYLTTLDRKHKEAKDEEGEEDDFFMSTAEILRQQAAEASGKQHRKLAADAHQRFTANNKEVKILRGHKLSATCASLAADDKVAYTGSKDGVICRWDIETCSKTVVHPTGKKFGPDVLTVAVNFDGTLVAFGGNDKILKVLDTRSNKIVEQFKGHRGTVSCLAFRHGTNSLYSGSHDRTIKVWNLDEMCYVDTLFGHQSEVTAVDALTKERCVTVGVDRTLRMWKIPEETQLILRGHSASIDAVSMLSETAYLAGSQDGCVTLWSVTKKKPVVTIKEAHGSNGAVPRWISATAAVPMSDLAATGSNDGFVRFYQTDANELTISPLFDAPLAGFVNGLCIASSGRFAFAAVGQEHRLGRWSRIPEGRNGAALIML